MRSLARSQPRHWTPAFETDDVPELIEQVRTRLLPKRGVFALEEEVLVTGAAPAPVAPRRVERLRDHRGRLRGREPVCRCADAGLEEPRQEWALLLSLGHHESHARRFNEAMQQRLALAAQALRERLPDFDFVLPQGGASIWLRAPAWVDGAELSLIARGHGVLIEAGNVFFGKPPYPCPFLRLRLSSIAAAQIPAGIRALGLAIDELAQARGEHRVPTSATHRG